MKCLPPSWRPSRTETVDALYSLRVGGRRRGSVRPYHLLYSGVVRQARTLDLDALLEGFEANLRLTVASHARATFLHAGVVGWRGRAIVLPGRSFSGKTTLVRALIEAGATYFSDEFAVLDTRGRVRPFAKPLSIRDASSRQTPTPVEALGGVAGTRPLPVGLVVLTEHRTNGRFRPESVSTGRAIIDLLRHAVQTRTAPERTLAALETAVGDARVVKGPRGEAVEAAGHVLRIAERSRP